ncbi:MAG: peptidylprolyl isomerase [Fimbriimonadaceae bacterium]|jgi:FKBP-type peptidyl-prolyl cis-trans isomerase|nr:peptidylprolyl isomerase [Fimbriimonadaceae bacterium]
MQLAAAAVAVTLLLGGSGLVIKDLKKGKGHAAQAGDTLTVHYTGKLKNGTVFDTSKKKGRTPFTLTLGRHQVIKGWDQGLVGMKVGGQRKLVIPPDMAYGSRDMGVIPPNSTLIFVVDLLKIDKARGSGK